MFNLPVVLATAGEPGQSIVQTLGVNVHMLVAHTICFLIVAAVLAKFAFKPVLGMLEERRQRIAQAQADAEQVKKELAETESERKRILHEVGRKAEAMLEETVHTAAKLREAELAKTREEAARIMAEARAAAVREADRMRTELRRELGRLAVAAAEQVARKMLTAEDRDRLAAEAVKDMERAAA